ncbi:GNAT family N-acetyltransferase [Thermomonas brevis]
MPPLIRDAAPGDIPAIAAIYADEVRLRVNTYEVDPPDDAEMARRMQTIVDGGYPYLVAELDGAVVGYAYAGPFRARAAYHWVVENSVYVVEGAQGRGVGAALLDALVEACARRGFRQMVAVIGEASNAASIRLHRRAGFEHIGSFPGIAWKHGRWLDTVFMQRALGAGNTEPPNGH